MRRPKERTVTSRLAAAVRLAEEGRRLVEHARYHHESQAKPHTTPVAKSWNEKLAGDMLSVIQMIDDVFGD